MKKRTKKILLGILLVRNSPGSRGVAALFALFAMLTLLLAATIMPPFQNADEPAHVYRADLVSHGRLLSKNLPGDVSGGKVDAGLRDLATRFQAIPFHRENKVTRRMLAPLDWGPRVAQDFSNTAIYPPIFYLPAAASLAAARGLNIAPSHGLLAARVATGVVSIAIATTAVAVADGAAVWLYAILTLPMSLCLMAAVSQDACMLASTALAIVLCRRPAMAQSVASWRHIALVSFLLALVGMARPPYAAFAVLILGMCAPWRDRIFGVLFVVVATSAWAWIAAGRLHATAFSAAIDPMAQLRALAAAPGQMPRVLMHTLHHWGQGLLGGFIGEPGWLDVDLPWWYQCVAWAVLGLALIAMLSNVRWRHPATLLVPAAIAGACLTIALLQYLTASIVGATEITGLQGRYFLPPALLIAALSPRAMPPAQWTWPLWGAVLTFPFVSIPVLVNAMVTRYYFNS